MKKAIFSFFYLVFISIGLYFVNHTFTGKSVSVYTEHPEELYGFTIQVQNHLGECIEGVSFQLYGLRDSTVPLSYINHNYQNGERISTLKGDDIYIETTTKKNGNLHFYGLEEGFYYLEETKVPKEYQVLKQRIEVYVDKYSAENGIDYYVINGKIKDMDAKEAF